MSSRISSGKLVVLALMLLSAASLRSKGAQIDETWIGGTGNWNVLANWNGSPQAIPNNGANTYRVFIDHGATGTSSLVSLDTPVQIDTLTIDAGDSLGINNNQVLAVLVGPISNAGTLGVNSTGSFTDLRMDGNISLTGGGSVVMSNGANNRIYGSPGTNRLTNVDNTIRGAGYIGYNLMGLTNQGIIQADQVTALTIDPSATGVINSGTMRATAGANLILLSGIFNNTGGTLEAQNGSTVTITSSTITSGILTSTGTGIIAPNSSSLDSVTNNGQLVINNNQIAAVDHTMTNNATISLNSTGSFTDLRMDTDVTLTGGGTIVMSNGAFNRLYGNSGTFRLTNVNNTIRGAGQIGANLMGLTNQSLIQADQATALTIFPSSIGAINTGTLRATAGATLTLLNGIFDNTGGTIEAQTGSTVSISSSTVKNGTLTTSGTGQISLLTGSLQDVTNNGQITIGNNQVGDVLGTTLTNTGSISLNSTVNFTDLRMDADISLTGGGSIAFSNSTVNRIYSNSGTARLTNVNNLIHGAGQIGVNLMSLTNQSVIQADQSAGLTIFPNAGGATNTGTLRATAGATLTLLNGTFDNTSGTIEAQTGSTVTVNNSTVKNGVLTTSGTGQVSLTGSTLQDVTNNAQVAIGNNQIAFLKNTMTNNATISLNSSVNFTDLRIDTDVTLTGGGTVSLSNSTVNRIYGSSGTNLLTNVNNTIQGAGLIGVNLMALTNQGTIDANQAASMTIDVADSTNFNNQGALKATGTGGIFINSGPFTTSGTVTVAAGSQLTRTGNYTQTAGTTTVNGAMSASGLIDIQGGVLKGSGTITGNVNNAGSIQPGNSAGLLTITGNYTQTSAGETSIEIGGTTVGTQYDRLAITGTAALGGTLRVNLINGFIPSPGNSFTIMTFASQTGSFSNVIVPCAPGGHLLRVDVSSTAVVVTALTSGLIGDMDCDCALTAADIDAFSLALLDPAAFAIAHPGCNINNADIDQNGIINGRDIAPFIRLFVP